MITTRAPRSDPSLRSAGSRREIASVKTARTSAQPRIVPLVIGSARLSFDRAEAAETKTLAALETRPLTARIEKMTPAQIFQAIRATEQKHAAAALPPISSAALERGVTVRVPISLLRPGQLQISSANVRSKMLDFVERIEERRAEDHVALATMASCPDARTELMTCDEALKAVVGPKGRYLVLTDGHHHVAALKAVQSVIAGIVGDGLAVAAGGRLGRAGHALEVVRGLFGGRPGVPSVPVQIVEDYRGLSEKEFWKTLSRKEGNRRLAYLEDHAGKVAPAPPPAFGKLEDNPFRYLASATAGKIAFLKTGDHRVKLKGADPPVWLKILGRSPDFIEFFVARVFEQAFKKAGIKYDPNDPRRAEEPTSEEERGLLRHALFQAQADAKAPHSAELQELMVLTRDRSKHRLRDELTVIGDVVSIPRKLHHPSERRLRKLSELAAAAAERASHRPRALSDNPNVFG